jgi:DNA-binding LytR/AlgR family response regulator
MRFLASAISVLILVWSPAAPAADYAFVRSLEICPPDGGACAPTNLEDVDPQGREIRLEALVDIPEALVDERPLGLFIAAKASSEIFFNGVRLGANGAPGASKTLETPGRMDAVFPIPDGVARAGANKVSVRMSSHHGLMRLQRPVHWIAVGPYADPIAARLQAMWPAFAAFGVIIAGGLYFAAAALGDAYRRDSILLALLAFFASCQLLAEMSRSLFAYPYPAHDLRLIAIVATSAGFGLTLAALTASRFARKRPRATFAGAAALTALPIFLAAGFDAKAGYSILAAALASALIAGAAAMKSDRQGLIFSTALLLFAVSIIVFRGAFLDAVFFFEVAALMLVLFATQAVTLDRERRERALERSRAHELEAALARAKGAAENPVIRVNGAGALHVVRASDLAFCSGAGDYVELHLSDGRKVLHNGALATLESELPPTFLRVHRSYIVNTEFVKSLKRESSGVGALVLSTGAEIPVSRRTMPKVREALV